LRTVARYVTQLEDSRMIRRLLAGAAVVLAALLVTPTPAQAQSGGFGIGPRLTFVRGSVDATDGTQRFSGGAIRLGGGKTALEIAMDFRSGVTGSLTERIKDYPIQGSLLVFPVRGRVAPYLVGGVGWYTQRVERLGPTQLAQESVTTRAMGYHGGFGAELRVHRHIALYGDYRYRMIRFGDDAARSTWMPFAERLKMSHEGSMFTWGATFYF
jgi:hypothetical protein